MTFIAALHHRLRPSLHGRENPAPNIRLWATLGLCGALFVASLSPLWDVWAINSAGVQVNRAIVVGTEAKGSQTEQDLKQAMNSLESLADHPPHTAARETPIWRTYGAAAALLPSNHAFELLLRSRNAGRLDRIGELWLGEVASATKRWDVAESAYMRIDASNLLIHRAEISLQSGDKTSALLQFRLAKKSLDAATERDTAKELLLDRTGNKPSVATQLLRSPGERATSLYRIGRGVMNCGQPAESVPILEQALAAAEAGSPGTVTEQAIDLALALALAKSLDPPSDTSRPYASYDYFALDPQERTLVDALVRIRSLAHHGVQLDATAASCVQAGRIMLLIGDDNQGRRYLEKALELDPRFPESYLVLGEWYESNGLITQARVLYAKGSEVLPGNVELAAALAVASYKTLPPQNALPALKHAADMPATDPYVFAYLGDCYADLGLMAQARAAYLEGLRQAPGFTALTERLSDLPSIQRILP